MKKVILFATAAMLMTGAAFANNADKGKKKKCAKGKTCCNKSKSCCKKKTSSTVPM
jgi:hypothetical protein